MAGVLGRSIMYGQGSDEAGMLDRSHGNGSDPKQDKRKTENARRKAVGTLRATRRLERNKLKKKAEPRDDKAQDDDRDTGS